MQVSAKLYEKFVQVLDDDETVYWVGGTNFYTYMFKPLAMLLFGLGWGAWVLFIILIFFKDLIFSNALSWDVTSILACFFFPSLAATLNFLVKLIAFFNQFYAVTNKRLLLRSGVLGVDYEGLDYDQICDLKVREGVFEKYFGVGTLIASMPDFMNAQVADIGGENENICFAGISEPHAVYRLIRRMALDVRSDWYYPNAKRPTENLGLAVDPASLRFASKYAHDDAPGVLSWSGQTQSKQGQKSKQNPDLKHSLQQDGMSQHTSSTSAQSVQQTSHQTHNQPLAANTSKSQVHSLQLEETGSETRARLTYENAKATSYINTPKNEGLSDQELRRLVVYDRRLLLHINDMLDDDEWSYWVGRPKSAVWFFVAAIVMIVGLFFAPLIALGLAGLIYYARLQTFYAITNKRFLRKTWLFGVDSKTIDFDRVNAINAYVDPLARIINAGHVIFYTISEVSFSFLAIAKPYEVERLAKIVALDVKSDIKFPNAM